MAVSIVFAAIAFTGAAFMARYLLALFRERDRSSGGCIEALRSRRADMSVQYSGSSYLSGSGAEKNEDRDYCLELMESEIHAKEASCLITLAIFPYAGKFHKYRFFG